jgi:hypothetical protein
MSRTAEQNYPRVRTHDRGPEMSAAAWFALIERDMEMGSKTLLGALRREHPRIVDHLTAKAAGRRA